MPLFERVPYTQQLEKTAAPIASTQRRPARSQAGEPITPENALEVSAVLAAFTILSEDIASLPLIEYQRSGREKQRAVNDPYYVLMHDQPNPEMTSMIFRELMVAHLLAWGNFYGQLVYDRAGVVQEIWPLRPDRMQVERVNGEKIYTYYPANGDAIPRLFWSDQVLHIPAFGFDGLVGYGRITLARNAIGLAKGAEKFGSKFFANDARPGMVLKHPKELSDKAYERLRDHWLKDHQGSENAFAMGILEDGLDLATIGVPPEDAQFLETRRFQVAEIARIFRVPPHMIGDVSGSTSWGSGIDSQEQGYVNHTLRPWTVRIEQGLNSQLLLAADRQDGRYFEHLFDALLRGDLSARYGAYVQAINNGIMSPNEVRERENMNPYDGGDEYYHPLNITSEPPEDSPEDDVEDETENNGGDTQAAVKPPMTPLAAMRPLFVATARRMIKRESNDLRGAVRRHLAKGQADEFDAFVSTFYGYMHYQYAMREIKPLLDATQAICGMRLDASVGVYLENYMRERLAWACHSSQDEIESELDKWSDTMAEKMADEMMVNHG